MNKKFLVGLMALVGVIGILTVAAPSYATDNDLPFLEQISILNEEMDKKDMLILEQVKVINELYVQIPKQYDGFSLEAFSDTDGFNPKWLKDNAEKIRQTCDDAESDGFYGLKYCNHIP